MVSSEIAGAVDAGLGSGNLHWLLRRGNFFEIYMA